MGLVKRKSLSLPQADSNHSSILHCSLNSYQEIAFLLPFYKKHLDFLITVHSTSLYRDGEGRGNKDCQKAFSEVSLKMIAQWAPEHHLLNGLNVTQLGRGRQPCPPHTPHPHR